MAAQSPTRIPRWAWAWPALSWVILGLALALPDHGVIAAAYGAVLIATVFAAVFPAEVVAHRVGEPFGTVILAVAVTVIEVGLIVSVMLGEGPRLQDWRATRYSRRS